MRTAAVIACLGLLVGSACGSGQAGPSGGRTAPHAAAPRTPLCGGEAVAPIRHVVLIMMENTSYAQATRLPYITRLRRRCGLATHYHAVTHPSLGDYIALTSGAIPAAIRGTDCSPSRTCRSLHLSIFDQLGRGWRVYAQSMPSRCSSATTSLYAVRHTAAPYYPRIRAACLRQQVRLRALADALASGRLHRFSLVVPNVVDDMHNGCLRCGDAFLKTWIRRVHAAPQYQNGSTVVFVTWDEDDGGASNHVPLLVISPHTPVGARVSARLTHYSLLRSLESLLGVSRLGRARTARGGITRGFGLR